MRNSEATAKRLLEAGTAEFAAHGIAGARVDRIAKLSGCNKQSIYGHFGNKEGLFEAVFDSMVAKLISGVPIDAYDLPGYAAQLFDWYGSHPDILRLSTWQQLETGRLVGLAGAAVQSNQEKVAKIREAQEAGAVTRSIPADHLWMLICRLTMVQLDQALLDEPQGASLRDALVEATRRLVAP